MQLAYPRRPVGGNAEALLEQKPLPSTCTYITFLIPLPKRFIFRAYWWQGLTVKSPGKKISILDTCFFFPSGPEIDSQSSTFLFPGENCSQCLWGNWDGINWDVKKNSQMLIRKGLTGRGMANFVNFSHTNKFIKSRVCSGCWQGI